MHESNQSLRLKKQLKRTRHKSADFAPRQFDWEGMRKRLAASQATLLALDDDTPEVLAQVWEQRAAQLAQRPTSAPTGEQQAVVVIRLGNESYGVEVPYVREVTFAHAMTPVPRVPPWVAGIVTQRGRIVSVIDLARFIGATALAPREDEQASQAYLVNVQASEMEVALLVDEVLGLELISIADFRPIESAPQGFRAELIRGVAHSTALSGPADTLIVLNIPALLADDQLLINETL